MTNKPELQIERMHYLEGDGPTKAFCDLLLMDTFIVKGLRVVKGKEGLFLGMPREQSKNGNWYDTFYPVSRDTRKSLEDLVLEEYNKND
jgi:stage V sporulation protein G